MKAGTKITVSNADSAPHTVTDEGAARSFDSGTIRGMQAGSVTFTKPGTFKYYCEFHATMKGTVTVVSLIVCAVGCGGISHSAREAVVCYAASRRASSSRRLASRSSARSSSLRVSGWVMPRRRLASRRPTGPSTPSTP